MAGRREHILTEPPERARLLPLPARDERGEGFVHANHAGWDAPLPGPLPTPSSWREGTPFGRNGGTVEWRVVKLLAFCEHSGSANLLSNSFAAWSSTGIACGGVF